MSTDKMFTGLNKEAWGKALEPQNQHLQKEYGFSVDTSTIDAEAMNDSAREATEFMAFMAKSLAEKVSAGDEKVLCAIQKHIEFLKKNMDIDAKGFAAQSRFFLTDDFHRGMLESQQVGLSYYICIAADNYATKENN